MPMRSAHVEKGLVLVLRDKALVEFFSSLEKRINMNMDIPKRYLTIEELAVYLGFEGHDGKPTTKSLYRLVSARSIPFIKPGGLDTLRFDIKAIDKWMEKHAVQAKPQTAA
jgi:excisionase family DNA binding protein